MSNVWTLSPVRRVLPALLACLIVPLAHASDGRLQPTLKVSYALSQPEMTGAAAEEGDLWDRIRNGFALQEPNPALVRTHEQWYARRPAHLERAIERSRPYLFHIVEEVERRGMPMEIALLPLIESAFDPQAVSPQKAAGIWQFIPSTGRVYGLKQNEWFDGRRDIVQATRAALDYLQYLHGMFNDWELALAAYNCGEGCVQRALRAGRQRGYADLRLPTETRHYVPKLIAVRNIVREPERFGVRLSEIADEVYFMQVRVHHPIEARQAARLAEMELDDFLMLNPAFQRRVIHTDTRGVLLLPADRVETFHHNMHSRGERKLLDTYSARQGESLQAIAQRFGVTVAWLREHNPVTLHQGRLTKAQTLVVPRGTAADATQRKVAEQPAGATPPRTHVVQRGDTLAALARRYNVRVADLMRWNDNIEVLMPGQRIHIGGQSG